MKIHQVIGFVSFLLLIIPYGSVERVNRALGAMPSPILQGSKSCGSGQCLEYC
jgi:hypothetical protein